MGSKLLILVGLLAAQPFAYAADYYFDNLATAPGNGTAASPFTSLNSSDALVLAPGDRILIRRSRTFTGQRIVVQNASGTLAQPIVVEPYGGLATDPRPIIAAAGVASAGVVVRNMNHVKVQGLEVSNWASTPAKRDGIRIEATDGFVGRLTNITIKDNVIHHVHGYTQRDRGAGQPALYDNAAIHVISHNYGTGAPSQAPFSNVLIEDNDLYQNNCIGIFTAPKYGTNFANMSNNVVIRGNSFDDGGADHMVIQGVDAPLIEYNVGYRAGAWGSKGYQAIAGMWVGYNTRNSLFRFNEVAYTFNEFTTGNGGDSQAFDVDYGTKENHIFEYNYTHHNEGGILIVMSADQSGVNYAKTTVYRYNLSVNDGRKTAGGCQFGVNPVEGVSTTHVHNNVIYSTIPEGIRIKDRSASYYSNNVFYAPSGIYPSGPRFSHNAYFGHDAVVNDPNKVTGNPKFVSPFPTGAGADGYTLANTQMFKTQADSPLINAGKTISIPGVTNLTKDFWGINNINVGRPDIGLYEHPTPAVGTAPAATTAAAVLYDDAHPSIAYTGTWVTTPTAPDTDDEHHASTLHRASGTGGTQSALITFTGTNITVYGKKAPSLGRMNVYLDESETLTGVADAYWPSEQVRTPLYTISGLAPGTHTLKLTTNGKNSLSSGTFVGLDYYEILPVTPPPAPLVTIIDDQAETSLTGVWDTTSPGDAYYGKTRSKSTAANATITYTFTGTGVRLYGPRANDRGTMEITVGTNPAVIVNQHAPVGIPGYIEQGVRLFEVTNLPAGSHTLTAKVTSPSTKMVVIDWLEALTSVGAGVPVKVDTTAALVSTGAWTHTADPLFDMGTKSVANTNNASMAIAFTGTKARLYVRRGPNLGKLNISVDSGAPTLVDCNAATSTYGYMIYETATLPAGMHTLKATVYDPTATNKYVGLDYFEYIP